MSGILKVTILGCGSSGGVPRIGNIWGECDPDEPRNRRRRCSVLVQKAAEQGGATTDVLIDTSPDMADQLNMADQGRLDAVLYTHAHADQAHGIDDLRMVAMNIRARVDVYMDKTTESWLMNRFDYCFETPPGSGYPPILNAHKMTAHEPVTIDGPGGPVTFEPLLMEHGSIPSLGFKVGGVAYSPDVNGVPQRARDALNGIDCWIVDALRRAPHPSHANLDMTLEWLAEMKPKLGVLTNMHVDLDYRTLCKELPEGVVPAYDGMVLEYEL